MTPRLLLLLLAACACPCAAQDSYVDPPSDWALEPLQPRQEPAPAAPRPQPQKKQPEAKPQPEREPAGPQPVATLPESATLQIAPQIEGPPSQAREPDPELKSSRRLRMDSTFSAFESVTTPPPLAPAADGTVTVPPPPQVPAEPSPNDDG
jgi:hypothetical protein